MINSVLTHRATIERSTETFNGGSPVFVWTVVSVRTPVLFNKDSSEFDPTWTTTQRRESDQRGTLLALPNADIRPGDRVRITRPSMSITLNVLPDPSEVLSLHATHHKEFKVVSA